MSAVKAWLLYPVQYWNVAILLWVVAAAWIIKKLRRR